MQFSFRRGGEWVAEFELNDPGVESLASWKALVSGGGKIVSGDQRTKIEMSEDTFYFSSAGGGSSTRIRFPARAVIPSLRTALSAAKSAGFEFNE